MEALKYVSRQHFLIFDTKKAEIAIGLLNFYLYTLAQFELFKCPQEHVHRI